MYVRYLVLHSASMPRPLTQQKHGPSCATAYDFATPAEGFPQPTFLTNNHMQQPLLCIWLTLGLTALSPASMHLSLDRIPRRPNYASEGPRSELDRFAFRTFTPIT